MNFTLIRQLLPAAKLAPQGLVCEKSAAFAPAILMPVMLSAAFPGLDSVTGCAAEAVPDGCAAKVSEVVLKLAIGAAAVTVREKFAETTRAAESLTDTMTAKVPDAVGVPERTPVNGEMLKPAGRPVALQK